MNMSKQQTAVEWLWEIAYNRELTIEDWKQAKEIEKEQHATTWDKSMDNLDARGGNIVRAWVDFDDYYEQTYGGNK